MAGTVSEVVTEIKIGTGGLPIENELLSEIAKRKMEFSSHNNSNKPRNHQAHFPSSNVKINQQGGDHESGNLKSFPR